MRIFITSGTFPYLINIIKQHPNEQLLLLHNNNSSLLLHESEHTTLFKAARKYEVIVQTGPLKQEGYVAMYHIPVNPEGQSVFEHAYKQHLKQLATQTGLRAIRFLRPLGSESYIILTQWNEESAFKAWEASTSFISLQDLKLPKGSAQKLFTGDPFYSKYSVPTID